MSLINLHPLKYCLIYLYFFIEKELNKEIFIKEKNNPN